MENKNSQNYINNFINNLEEQEIKNDYSQYGKVLYYQSKQNNRNVIDSPKVIQNKNNNTSNSTIYSSYQQNKKILKNSIPNNLNIKINKKNEIDNNNSFSNQNINLSINAQIPAKSYQINQNQLNQDVQKSIQNYQISNNQLNIIKQSKEEFSPYSQKPLQTYENNINNKSYINNNLNNNKNINNIKVIKNSNMSNIVNIDNQSSAIELSFIAKKPKKNYKISSIVQVGTNQTPIGFSFIAEKPNKYMNNNNLNESNGQNISFISSKQIDLNDLSQFPKQDMSLSVSKSNKNLKIMTHSKIKNGQKDNNCNQSKPKPILQIVSKNNSYNKILQENLLPQPQINGFSIVNNKNKDLNEITKNNFIYISKSGNEIFNNYNQDLSFISNSRETENLFEINGININDYKVNCSNSGNISPPKDKPFFSINNGLSSSQQSANNKNNYIMINNQFCYISSKIRNKNNNYEYIPNDLYCSIPKKRIKIEYYDAQPVSFNIISFIKREEELKKKYEIEFKKIYNKKEFKNCIIEQVNQIQFRPFKMFRAVEMEYIVNNEVKNEDKKELENDEDISEKSFNNYKGNKKRKKRRKK